MKNMIFILTLSLCFTVLMVNYQPGVIAAEAPADGVTIYYEENAQVELINAAGTRVLCDVFRVSSLSTPPTEKDVLLTTHKHNDHFSSALLKSFQGPQLTNQEGELTLPDVKIRGIAAAHAPQHKIQSEGASNYIFVIELGGLRIAHFGGLHQTAFTPEQLAALGKIDVAIMVLTEDDSFALMDQLKPRLIIPTHMTKIMAEKTPGKWKTWYGDQKSITIRPEDLSDETQVVFMGMVAPSYGKILNLAKTRM